MKSSNCPGDRCTLHSYRKSQSRTGGIRPLTGGNRPRVETSPKLGKSHKKKPGKTCRNLQYLVTISVVGNLTDGTDIWRDGKSSGQEAKTPDWWKDIWHGWKDILVWDGNSSAYRSAVAVGWNAFLWLSVTMMVKDIKLFTDLQHAASINLMCRAVRILNINTGEIWMAIKFRLFLVLWT